MLHYAHSPIVIGQDHSVHLGGSFSYRWNASEDGTQFRTRPEIATVNDYYVDTGTIAGADRVRTLLAAGKKNLPLGLNWYLNQRFRLMANVIKVLDVDRPGSEYDGLDPLSLSLRVQWVLN